MNSSLDFNSLKNPDYKNPTATVSRFKGAEWFTEAQKMSVGIAGVGGIGSWLAFMLSRIDLKSITLIDDDKVQSSNLSGQLFKRDDIYLPKTHAIANTIHEFSMFNKINTRTERFQEGMAPHKILFCGFDNMMSRRIAYYAWKKLVMATPKQHRKDYLFMDGRLAAETFQIFCIQGTTPSYMDEYESEWLFKDNEADPSVCTYKQTSYCANMIGSIMTNLFINWVTNRCNPLIDRAVPFITEYSADQMYFKTKV